nr:hypothetical protein Iba_chr01cCG13800 [Ipomoea batatas]
MHIKANFLHCLYKPHKIISSFKIILARGRLMAIPEHIGVNNIQVCIFSLPYKIFPHLQGTSGVMYRAREEYSPLPIDDDGPLVIGDTAADQLCSHCQENADQEEEEEWEFGN